MTPYIVVNASAPQVQVPQQHVTDDRIVLNISPNSCRGLHLENDRIVFTTRFSGIATQIFLTPDAVLAIYAKENGRGMEFSEEYNSIPSLPPKSESLKKGSSKVGSHKKPKLKLVEKPKD